MIVHWNVITIQFKNFWKLNLKIVVVTLTSRKMGSLTLELNLTELNQLCENAVTFTIIQSFWQTLRSIIH